MNLSDALEMAAKASESGFYRYLEKMLPRISEVDGTIDSICANTDDADGTVFEISYSYQTACTCCDYDYSSVMIDKDTLDNFYHEFAVSQNK